jgi:GNAT superfamily N-acetyltransferase
MTTRLATADDAEELVRLINEAYRVEDFFVNGNRTNLDDVRRRISAPNQHFIVIDGSEGNSLAGAVWVEINHGRGHFGLLSVDPAYQGTGLGRKLVHAVEDHCRRAGCTDLDLEVVNLRTELPPFYRKLGFEPSGEAPFTDTDKLTRDAHLILMTKALPPSPLTNA